MAAGRNSIVFILIGWACAWVGGAMPAAGVFEQSFVVEEALGLDWQRDLVVRDVTAETPGLLFPGKAALVDDRQAPVPFQLEAVQLHEDGSIRSARIWFAAELQAGQRRTWTLRPDEAAQMPDTDLTLTTTGAVLEIANRHTALRLPAGTWPPSEERSLADRLGVAEADGHVPGPLLGVRLPSGAWTAASTIASAAAFQGYTAEILDHGPLFVRTRVRYRFADDGHYTATYTLRADDPLIRIEEEYADAGTMHVDLYAGLAPTRMDDHVRAQQFQAIPLAYTQHQDLPSFTGWDFYLTDRSMVMGFGGGAADDYLGLLSIHSDWLPFPYNNMWHLTADQGPALTARSPLTAGQRRYALLVTRGAQFPEGAADLFRWWNRRVAVPLGKVANWRLTWPGMEDIVFPHTFFSEDDLPGIRDRLQADPVTVRFMTDMRENPAHPNSPYFWGLIQNEVRQTKDPDRRAVLEAYIERYHPQGIVSSISDLGAWTLYSEDPLYLRQLKDGIPRGNQESTPEFLRDAVRAYTRGLGMADQHRLYGMELCDRLFQRIVGFELLMAGDWLTPEDRREALTHAAFLVYLMHDPLWMPENHPYAMTGGYIGYGQGTDNQKQGIWTTRAMWAALLANHPMKAAWLADAIETDARNMPYQINEHGVFYESAHYSHRTMSRIGPFWMAMERAGVPLNAEIMARAGLAFRFLGDTLTPPDPRFGGIRTSHTLGRGWTGAPDPTLLAGVAPWGLTDRDHGKRMRWIWESMGRPPINPQGGRDTALHLLAASYPFEPAAEPPLRSVRWPGFGAMFRANVAKPHESNVLQMFEPFAWYWGGENHGALYFWGKGAPLLPRFGAYWSAQKGQPNMQTPEFANKVILKGRDNREPGGYEAVALLGDVADYLDGATRSGSWRRQALFAKDMTAEDPVYLLVRDDVAGDLDSALHWWVMSRDVQPRGPHDRGYAYFQGTDAQWIAGLGTHWQKAVEMIPPEQPRAGTLEERPVTDHQLDDVAELLADDAPGKPEFPPVLHGPLHRLTGQYGVDLDLFLARPADPVLVTDVAGHGPGIAYCVDSKYIEVQQLVRVEGQAPGAGYTTLLVPRRPQDPVLEYRSLADGAGVAVSRPDGEDRLFLFDAVSSYEDETVSITARAGFARHGGAVALRLMVCGGSIRAADITLTSDRQAALRFDGRTVILFANDAATASVELSDELEAAGVMIEYAKKGQP